MSVDKFGRAADQPNRFRSLITASSGRGLTFMGDGNINIENLKLCNVKRPTNKKDAANKDYVDSILEAFKVSTSTAISNNEQSILAKFMETRDMLQANNNSFMQGIIIRLKNTTDDFDVRLTETTQQLNEKINGILLELSTKLDIAKKCTADIEDAVGGLADKTEKQLTNLKSSLIIDIDRLRELYEALSREFDSKLKVVKDHHDLDLVKLYKELQFFYDSLKEEILANTK